MTQRHQTVSDIIDERFFFECPTTEESFTTDNEAVAWQKFNACQFPCELFDDGNIVAEKDWEFDPINDRMTLVDTNYTGEEYADLEMAEL